MTNNLKLEYQLLQNQYVNLFLLVSFEIIYLNTSQVMKGSKSPKGQKLIQLRDKLARMNGHPVMAGERQKLIQICSHNKVVQSQISTIFDSISQYYYKSEERILTISKQIIEHVHRVESALLKQLQQLKQKELDSIKEDVDNYLKLKRKTKRLFEQLETTKGNNQQLVKSISKLQPFPIKTIQSKIEKCQADIDDINHNVERFANLIQILNQNNTEKNIDKQQSRLKIDYLRRSHMQSSSSDQSQKIIRNTSNKRQIWLKDLHSQSDILQKKQKQEKQQENLIDQQENQIKNYFKSPKKQLKLLKFYKSDDQQQQCEQNTLKYKRKSIQKTPALGRKQSHPTIANTSLKSNIEQFLVELKKSKNEQFSNEISTQQKHQIVQPSSRFLISRVKSEQNIYLRKTKGTIQNTQGPLQISKPKIAQQVSSATSINLSQNRLRESKSIRKGNWANILKDQQIKYNQMRKKLKG